jgi:hypothetical protein
VVVVRRVAATADVVADGDAVEAVAARPVGLEADQHLESVPDVAAGAGDHARMGHVQADQRPDRRRRDVFGRVGGRVPDREPVAVGGGLQADDAEPRAAMIERDPVDHRHLRTRVLELHRAEADRPADVGGAPERRFGAVVTAERAGGGPVAGAVNS